MFTAFRFFARLFYFAALAAALILISYANRSHAQGVGPKGEQISSRADEKAPTADEAINRYTKNMTQMAREGKFAPFAGKNEKILQVRSMIARRASMILIGESGKTSLMEHMAGTLTDKTIYSLDLQALMGGSAYRGSLEERLQALTAGLRAHPEAVLFIENLKSLAREGKEDVRDAILQMVANREVPTVMEVTEEDYKEFIEPNRDLKKNAEMVQLDPLTRQDLLDIANIHKKRIEGRYGILIASAALKKAVKLVLRFEPSEERARALVNLIDGAAANELQSRQFGSHESQLLLNKKTSIELELNTLRDEAPRRTGDSEFAAELEDAQKRLETVEKEIVGSDSKAQIAAKQMELSLKINEAKALELKADLEGAARIRYVQIPVIEKEIRALNIEPLPHTGDLTDRHIERYYAVSKGYNLPVIADDEYKRLENIAKTANERVLFQEKAVKSVMTRLRIRAAEVEAPKATILVWDGPNGVGKTALANVIADLETGRAPILIDGNKYQGANSAWQLLGAGKGHVDTMSGGDLDPLRLRPNSVVLIDEGNLASSDFWNLLYQLGSEGMARDMRGRLIDARNAIIIVAGNFTQNYSTFKNHLSNERIEDMFRMPRGTLNGLPPDERDARVLDQAMKLHNVPPGMRDRFAGSVTFEAFDLTKATRIAKLQLENQARTIFENHRVTLTWDASVEAAIAKAGFDLEFNVRPVDRARSDNISDFLADVRRDWKRGDKVHLEFTASPDERGGILNAKLNDVKVAHIKGVVFKAIVDPKAAAARVMGEAGKAQDPTDPKKQTKADRKKGGRR